MVEFDTIQPKPLAGGRSSLNRHRRPASLMLAAAVLMPASRAATGEESAETPSHVRLIGTVRDFRERSESGGHADFERKPDGGFGLYSGMVADDLGADLRPLFVSRGSKVSSQAKDAEGRPIIGAKAYIDGRAGDQPVVLSSSSGAIESVDTANLWFRDVPGINVATSVELKLNFDESAGVYIFDDKLDPLYSIRNGFFPIDGELYGNSRGESKNYHFTYHIHTSFIHEEGQGKVFRFIGDDDVWVFVDGKLVIDLGGVHAAESQTIDFDRLQWLVDGQSYSLDFFFAERHRTQSNFRIETSLRFKRVEIPRASALWD